MIKQNLIINGNLKKYGQYRINRGISRGISRGINSGFTIIELILVMAIIAILILIAVPMFTKYINKAENTHEIATANTIYKSATASVLEDYLLPIQDRTLVSAFYHFEEDLNNNEDRNNIQKEIIKGVDARLPTNAYNRNLVVFGYDDNWAPSLNSYSKTKEFDGTWRVYLRVPTTPAEEKTPGNVNPIADIYILSPNEQWFLNGKPYNLPIIEKLNLIYKF